MNGNVNGDTQVCPMTDVPVRYIKLGEGGEWAQFALNHGLIPFDCYGVNHAVCQAGGWDAARRQLEAEGQRDVGDALRQLKDFYEQPQDTIWFTFVNRSLYWTTADEAVQLAPKQEAGLPKRWRQANGGWRNESLTGEQLSVDNLSSALTKVAAYPKSICGTGAKDYLLRRIRATMTHYLNARSVIKQNQSILRSK